MEITIYTIKESELQEIIESIQDIPKLIIEKQLSTANFVEAKTIKQSQPQLLIERELPLAIILDIKTAIENQNLHVLHNLVVAYFESPTIIEHDDQMFSATKKFYLFYDKIIEELHLIKDESPIILGFKELVVNFMYQLQFKIFSLLDSSFVALNSSDLVIRETYFFEEHPITFKGNLGYKPKVDWSESIPKYNKGDAKLRGALYAVLLDKFHNGDGFNLKDKYKILHSITGIPGGTLKAHLNFDPDKSEVKDKLKKLLKDLTKTIDPAIVKRVKKDYMDAVIERTKPVEGIDTLSLMTIFNEVDNDINLNPITIEDDDIAIYVIVRHLYKKDFFPSEFKIFIELFAKHTQLLNRDPLTVNSKGFKFITETLSPAGYHIPKLIID